MQAKIVLEYIDPKDALAITYAVSPDNFSAPSNLIINTSANNNIVITEMKTEKKLSALIATIDDFLFCVSTAEKAIHIMKNRIMK
ncbi:hypothetical protein E2P47_03900 [Candidatus Bathyarchaeota archaeon]|nr:hypothetical protein E2P47_03900 [Candidatus Bathyarchaeota archaeon]